MNTNNVNQSDDSAIYEHKIVNTTYKILQVENDYFSYKKSDFFFASVPRTIKISKNESIVFLFKKCSPKLCSQSFLKLL